MGALHLLLALLQACLIPRASLAAENLALRQQVIVLRRSVRRPKLRNRDRVDICERGFIHPRRCAG